MIGLAEYAAGLLGSPVASASAFAGGSLSSLDRVRLVDGREMLVKSGPLPQAEARMLHAIEATGVPTPQVLAVDETVLAIERLPDDGDLQRSWGDLGHVLRQLHATTGKRYGWDEDYAFGQVPVANGWDDDWPRFFAEKRLMAAASGTGTTIERRVEALCARLTDILPKRPAPSLLHGDLWSGNILTVAGKVSGLIDPASYYGHGEVDIAMLGLFATPSDAFFEAYGRLSAGHGERIAVYSLWPALVHLALFGSGYRGMVDRYLQQAGF